MRRRQNPSQALRDIVGESKASELEELFGDDVRRIFGSDYPTLVRAGVSPSKAKEILRAGDVVREWMNAGSPADIRMRSPDALAAHFRARLVGLEIEQFWGMATDAKLRALKTFRISEGSIDASMVHPREVFAPLLRLRAAACAFCHNHPSGDPRPSQEDIGLTRRLMAVAEILGMRVLDHTVLGSGTQFYSFQANGLLSTGR